MLGVIAVRRTAVSRAGRHAQFSAARWFCVRTGHGPLQRYRDLVARQEINHDENQERVVALLDTVSQRVANYSPSRAAVMTSTPGPAAAHAAANGNGGGWFGSLLGGGNAKAVAKPVVEAKLKPSGPKGLYVWGGCGTGKTFLMDLFYEAVPVQKKTRIHFHEWMIDVHERLHRLQSQNQMVKNKANTVWTADAVKAQREQLSKGAGPGKESADDLVAKVAEEMINEAWLLCFDEFQVTHISDAIIMKRLFSILFEKGAVVVATSNRPPEDLYKNGLNRPLFLPFIPMIQDFCDVHDIASGVDYRMLTTEEDDDRRVFLFPNGPEESRRLERKFYKLACSEVSSGLQVETQGRRIVVPKSAVHSKVACFKFKDLCDKPLGAADYLAIAGAFHTVFVADIPQLTMQERDQVRRFITMIDAFYEKHTKIVCTADCEPATLFTVTDEERKTSVADEIFAWDRTVSRLVEMQSSKYLAECAKLLDGEQFLGQFDLQALQHDEIEEFFRRYDRDENGQLDGKELRLMFEDLLELHRGHRNVSDALYTECMTAMGGDDLRLDLQNFEEYAPKLTAVSAKLQM